MSSPPGKERPLHWVGSAKRGLLEFPGGVVDEFGYGLGVVQLGGQPPAAKPWKGEGPGVFELVEDHRGDTFRVAYTVRFAKAVAPLLPEEIAFRYPHCPDRHQPDSSTIEAGSQ